MTKHIFHVAGTHCPACKILIEDTVGEKAWIRGARVDLAAQTLAIETDDDRPAAAIAGILTESVRAHGYTVSVDAPAAARMDRGVFLTALPVGIGILLVFVILQRSGLIDVGVGGELTPVTGLLVGLIASVSSCLAVVGGLVLSLSATVARDDVSDTRTFVLFHVGRLVGFALLGGLLGALGEAIGISFTASAVLGIVASLIMIALGLNLLGILRSAGLTLPSGVFAFFRRVEHRAAAPLLLGAATFFLPCGFTQAMQFAALASGSFLSGMLIMLSFALGTLPVLAALSFGATSFAQGRHAPLFFASAGVVVVGLGLLTLFSSLAALGIIAPLSLF